MYRLLPKLKVKVRFNDFNDFESLINRLKKTLIIRLIWINFLQFLFLSVMTIAGEIGGIISLSILKTKVSDIVTQGWEEVNQRTRNVIQDQVFDEIYDRMHT